MPSIKQHIAKGFYQYSQLNGFISVKNYIFTRINNKKCLLVRFSNDMGYAVNSMSFTVVQFNGAGKVIAKKKITYDGINFGAGTTYVAQNGIAVAEECRDFKIYFNCVRSGKYKYVVKNGEIIVLYDNNSPKQTRRAKARRSHTTVSVRKIGVSAHKWSLVVAVIALIATLVLCFFNQYREYSADNKGEAMGKGAGLSVISVLADTTCNESYSPCKSFKV